MKKVIFVIQGYNEKSEDGRLLDIVTIDVYAKTEKEAIKRAKAYVKKSFYRVTSVIEK